MPIVWHSLNYTADIKYTIITLALSALLGATAQSATIVYTFSGTGSGTVNSTTFVDVPFTIQVVADTSNIVGPAGTFYEVPDDSSTITIPGIGTATFTGNLRVFAISTAVGFGRVAGGDLLDMDHPTAFQCATTIKAGRRRQLELSSWDGGFLG